MLRAPSQPFAALDFHNDPPESEYIKQVDHRGPTDHSNQTLTRDSTRQIKTDIRSTRNDHVLYYFLWRPDRWIFPKKMNEMERTYCYRVESITEIKWKMTYFGKYL